MIVRPRAAGTAIDAKQQRRPRLRALATLATMVLFGAVFGADALFQGIGFLFALGAMLGLAFAAAWLVWRGLRNAVTGS